MSTVLIRDAKLSDAPRLLEIYSYYVKNTAITFEYNVPSLEEFRHRMKNITLRRREMTCSIFSAILRNISIRWRKNSSEPALSSITRTAW